MPKLKLTRSQVAQFQKDGYVIIPQLFEAEICELTLKIAKADPTMKQAYARKDAQGGTSKLWLSGELSRDIYGAIASSQRVVGPMEQLLDGKVLHFHHKMMQKEPFVGGAWEWHQDYGYWYLNEGFLWPHMASCMIAVDRANRENGCLQVLKGSHHLGRIEHALAGTQQGADLERVNAALKHLELVYVELEPGSAVFFHSNVLHRSDQNRSPNPRWSLVCCYARADNPPCKKVVNLQKIEPLDDPVIKTMAREQWQGLQAA